MTRRRVLDNSLWLMADKVVRLGLGLLVWLWLARQVGPEGFGQWNFAIAFAALFAVIAGLGLDGLLQRELVTEGADAEALLGTALAMRLVAGLSAAAICVVAATLLRSSDPTTVWLVAMNAVNFTVLGFQVTDFHFQARMKARPAVLAVNAAFLVSTLIRLALLWAQASLLWFGVTLVFETSLAALLLLTVYRRDGGRPGRWRLDMAVARRLLHQSWPLLLSGMAVMLYMRIDQVMLATMADDAAVGQFSAALRISEVWYFIPAAVMTAAFPAMMTKRQLGNHLYEAYIQRLYDAMAWMGIGVAVVVSVAAPRLIELLYGSAYSQAASVLRIQVWAGVAVAMSYVHSRWLLAEGLQRMGLYYTLVGCAVNLSLNAVLIPRFGAPGAAWATLAAQIGVLPVQLVFQRGRRNFVLMLNAVTAPVRLFRRDNRAA